jgi:hypothetical protein
VQIAGTFEVRLAGMGLQPKEHSVTDLSCLPGSSTTGTITFTNPFLDKVMVKPTLEGDKQCPGALSIPPAEQPLAINGLASTNYPVTYTPVDSKPACGMVCVNVTSSHTAKPLPFRFPVVGSVEPDTVGSPISLTTKARQELHEVVALRLEGAGAGTKVKDLDMGVSCSDGTSADKHGLSVSVVRCSCMQPTAALTYCTAKGTPMRVCAQHMREFIAKGARTAPQAPTFWHSR